MLASKSHSLSRSRHQDQTLDLFEPAQTLEPGLTETRPPAPVALTYFEHRPATQRKASTKYRVQVELGGLGMGYIDVAVHKWNVDISWSCDPPPGELEAEWMLYLRNTDMLENLQAYFRRVSALPGRSESMVLRNGHRCGQWRLLPLSEMYRLIALIQGYWQEAATAIQGIPAG